MGALSPVCRRGLDKAAQEGSGCGHSQLKVEGAPDDLLHTQDLALGVCIVCDVAALLTL